MVLSITHRGTGLIQSGLMTGFALFPFVTSLSYPAALAQVTEMGLAAAPILFAAKFAIVWPVMFHLFNGFRHLVSLEFINDNFKTSSEIKTVSMIFTFTSLSVLFVFQSWDMGWGFQIVDLYKTGYTVSALSVLTSVILCLL